MTRRSRTRGHVREHGRGWVAIVDLGQRPAQRCTECRTRAWVVRERPTTICAKCEGPMGPVVTERRQRWETFATKGEANRSLTKLLGVVDKGGDPEPEERTVREHATTWMGQQAKRVRPSTLRRYAGIIQTDLLPILGDLRLDHVRPSNVRAALVAMSERGCSAASVRQGRAVLSSMMRQAVEDGLVPVNPCTAVKPAKGERRELVVPDADQIAKILAAARGSTYELPLVLAVATGARRSEVLGVRWSDVDLPRKTFRIDGSLQRVPGEDGRELRRVAPKTTRSRRTVPLPPFAVAALQRARKDQTRRQLALGPGWFHDEALGELVCDRGDGGPIDPDNLTGAFRRFVKVAGLDPRTRLHDLRHAVATRLAEDPDVPLVAVSALLGHSSASFTASVYMHGTDAMAKRTADAIERAFGAGL